MKHAWHSRVPAMVLAAAATASCAIRTPVAPARPGSYLVVLNKADCTMSVVEPNSGWTKDYVATGVGPHEVAVARDGSIAVATNYGEKTPGSSLSVYDFRERRVVDTIELTPHERPHGIVFLDNRSTVLVTSETSRAVLEVSIRGRRVVRAMDTGAEGSHMLVLSGDRRRVFTSNLVSGSVSAIDLRSGNLIATVPTGRETEGIDLSPDGRELWVGNRAEDTLTILDAGTLERRGEVPCKGFPIRVKFTPDGAHVLVSCAAAGEIAVVDARTREETLRIPLPAGEPEDGRPPPAPQPVGLLVDPRGRSAFVACTGARKLAVIDLATWTVSSEIRTGNGPDGMAWAYRSAADRLMDDPTYEAP